MENYTVKPGNRIYHVQNSWSNSDAPRNVCGIWMKLKKQPAVKFGLVSAAALSVMGVLGMSSPALADSSLRDSCPGVVLLADGSLDALCFDKHQTKHPASLRLMGIENQNGNLVDTGDRGTEATFQNSCTNLKLDSTRYITATCTTDSGDPNVTYVELLDVTVNDDGQMVYRD